MYQIPIYMCISWCSKICWFPVKKCWCQQNSRNVSRDLRYKCGKFHHCRTCEADFREEGPKSPPPIREQPRNSPSWIGLSSTNFNNYVNAGVLKVLMLMQLLKTQTAVIQLSCHHWNLDPCKISNMKLGKKLSTF